MLRRLLSVDDASSDAAYSLGLVHLRDGLGGTTEPPTKRYTICVARHRNEVPAPDG